MIQHGIRANRILCITFTNKAADEMKARVAKSVGAAGDQIFVSTFHRLCSTLLREHGGLIGYRRYLTIMDEDESVDLMSQVARRRELELTKPQIKKICWILNDSRENLETDEQLFSRFDEAKIEHHYYVAKDYLEAAKGSNRVDFSGLLSETYRLLTERPEALRQVHARWSHFQVDEVQDTNYAQFKIVELIANHTKNVFVVGDLDQSIYGWRGARSENIRDFQKSYPGTKIISLGKNYRSTPQIVAVADQLIRHNMDRIAAKFETDNPPGPPVAVRAHPDDRIEAQTVARQIRQLVHGGHYSYKQVAVFYRMNAMSRAVEMAMIENNIPHTMIGSFSFFDRKEVKDCISMLKFLVNPCDGVSFHRIANKPKRALGDVTVGKIEKCAAEEKCTILEAIDRMDFKSESVNEGLAEIKKAFCFDFESKSVAECLDHVLKSLRYDEYLKLDEDSYEERKSNIDELIRDVARYSSIEEYLEHCALATSSDKEPDGNSVSLMSLHASKGLEFPVVFMLGVEQDILPHKKAVQERDDGMEEERRLCYVGMTRAEKVLVVNYCLRRQDTAYAKQGKVSHRASKPSQFLYEAGLLKRADERITDRNEIDSM